MSSRAFPKLPPRSSGKVTTAGRYGCARCGTYGDFALGNDLYCHACRAGRLHMVQIDQSVKPAAPPTEKPARGLRP